METTTKNAATDAVVDDSIILAKLLGWLNSSGIAGQLGTFFGNMIAPTLVPIIREEINNAFEKRAVISRPDPDLQSELDGLLKGEGDLRAAGDGGKTA